MKSKLIWIIGIIVVLLLGILLLGSFYFSSLLLDSETSDLAGSEERMQNTLQNMNIPDEVSLTK